MTTPRFLEEATVLYRRDLADGFAVLGFEAPRIAASARPGQFAMLSVRPPGAPGQDPLLPRPFSFLRAGGGVVEFFIRSVGRGTVMLSRASAGERFMLLGPLGRGFEPPADPDTQAIFVAGGIGVAPFLHFAESFRGRRRPILLYGGKSARDLQLLPELCGPMDVKLATEDGSLGTKGFVTELLKPLLDEQGGPSVELYTCGRPAMMEAVAKLARGVPVQASLEARMACGIGICRGCAVKVAKGNYVEVCVDGPVYDAHAVWG